MFNYRDNRTNLITARRGLLIFMLLILLGALFPYGTLQGRSPFANYLIVHVFQSDLSHIIAHFLLFFAIGGGLLALFPVLRRYPVLYASVIINIGVAQEFLQLATFKRRPVGRGDLFDLLVDLIGATTVYLLFIGWRWLGKEKDHA